jgi:photosystem II stability/assembly factor-like uncharacterized protein
VKTNFILIKTISFIILLLSQFASKAQWNQVYYASSSSQKVFDLDYNNDHSVHIARKSSILYSENDGLSWSTLSTFISLCPGTATPQFTSLEAQNKDSVYVAGTAGSLSSNNCFFRCYNSFSTKYCGNIDHVDADKNTDIDFITRSIGYSIDNYEGIYKTIDGGVNWVLKYDGTGYSTNGFIDFPTVDTGYVFIGATNYRTVNGGSTLTPISISSTTNVESSCFINGKCGFVIMGDGSGDIIRKTTDAGLTWSTIFPSGSGLNIYDIYFINTDTGYVCGSEFILKTIDGGNSWFIQRFPNYFLKQMDFLNADEGMVAGDELSGGHNIVLHTGNGGGSYKPFSFFYPYNGYCCATLSCSIMHTGPAFYTYDWYVDGTYIGSGSVPGFSGLSGTHTLEVITSYLGLSDTFSLSVYFASPLSASHTIGGTILDSTICNGSTVKINGINTYSGYTYCLKNGATIISPVITATGASINIISDPYTGPNFIITAEGKSMYSACPGNTLTKNFNVTVYQPPPANSIFSDKDSVCIGDSAVVSIITNAGGTYFLKRENISSVTEMYSITGSADTINHTFYFNKPYNNYTSLFYYTVNDIDGCTFSIPKIKIKLDSVYSDIYTPLTTIEVNDTIVVRNYSTGIFHNWNFSINTLLFDTINPLIQKVGYSVPGSNSVELIETNKTGCRDTFKIYINSIVPPDTSLTSTTCNYFNSSLNIDINYGWCLQQPQLPIHVDRFGNMYTTCWNYYSGIWITGDATIFNLHKYAPDGSLKWKIKPWFDSTYSIGFEYLFSTCDDITSDSLGNIYIIGQYSAKRIGFGSFYFPALSDLELSDWDRRSYIAKIDSLGNFIWVNTCESVGALAPGTLNAIEYLDNGHIYVHADKSILNGNFQNGTHPFNNIIQLDSHGNFIKTFGVPLTETSASDSYYLSHCNNAELEKIPEGILMKAMGNRLIVYNTIKNASGAIPVPDSCFYTLDYMSGYYSESGIITLYDTNGTVIKSFLGFQYFQDHYKKEHKINPIPLAFYDKNGYGKMAVDKNFNIYISFYPFEETLLDSLPLFENDNYYVPGLGLYVNQGNKGIIQKLDTNGNILFSNFTSTRIKGLACNNDNNVYGTAQYNFFATFTSKDSSLAGILPKNKEIQSLLFSYDGNGNLNWLEEIKSDSVTRVSEISSRDTCNSDLYFMTTGFDSITFNGIKSLNNHSGIMFHFSPTGACTNVYCTPPPSFPTDITTYESSGDIEVFPNPTTGSVIIRSDKITSTCILNVIDIYGKKVKYLTFDGIVLSDGLSMDIFNLDNGVYIISIETKNKRCFSRLIKQR